MTTPWDFACKYYPDYDHSDTIAHEMDLDVILTEQVTEGSCAERLLNEEYGGDPKNPQIKIDHDAILVEIYQDAIEEYIRQQQSAPDITEPKPTSARNRVTLMGTLGADPEMKTTEGGHEMTRMSVGETQTYKESDGSKTRETQWHNVVAFSDLAKKAFSILKAGQSILIEGKLSQRSYLDKDGIKRYLTEVVASDFVALKPINE